MNVHPYADAFPMMSEDELDALADDIRANGLRHPIVVDADGTLIDGRNRFAACERAKVDPRFVKLEGDPVAFITSVNVRRRQMTKGQTAIVAVRAFSKSENQEWIARQIGVPPGRVGEAATVVEFAPDLADRVLGVGRPLSFDAAYRDAKDRRQKLRQDAADVAELRAEALDLAEMVDEETLTFDEAWAAYDKRTEDARRNAQERAEARARRNVGLAEAVHKINWSPLEAEQFIADVLPVHDRDVAAGMRVTAERIDAAIDTLTMIRKAM